MEILLPQECCCINSSPENTRNIIINRIKFVENINKFRDNFQGKNLLQKSDNGTYKHPYKHFIALRNYLLLTCFDILGSNDDYLPFNSWLESKSKEDERNSIIGNFPEKLNILDSTKLLFKEYNKIYGIKNGFKRFILEILTAENKLKLLESIIIEKHYNDSSKKMERIDNDNKKINFLFEVRNVFTHSGLSYASSGAGLFGDMHDGAMIKNSDGKLGQFYTPIYIEHKKDFYYIFMVRGWPYLLMEILYSALDIKYDVKKMYPIVEGW